MPDEQPTIYDPAREEPQTHAFEPIEDEEHDEWLDDQDEQELPRRARRRLLGVGGNPIALALLGALLVACGFIAGVQVQKGEASSTSATPAGGLASRFAALRGASASTGTSSTKAPTSAGAGFPGTGTGGTRPTTGTVAYLSGKTLYVTDSEGNTVKVKTSASTSVTKTVKTKVTRIFPGETVTITGATDSTGVLSAESISVGSSGGGLATLLGSAGTSSSSSAGATGSSGRAALVGAG